MIVAGIGCRRGATADAIIETLSTALAQAGVDRTQLAALAAAEEKCGELGIVAASRVLSLPLIRVSSEALREAGARALTFSERVQTLKGVPSMAEAAAIAAAGANARLLAPRSTTPTAACALATGDGR
jgi:cobalt-precorrin 5A hydrolase